MILLLLLLLLLFSFLSIQYVVNADIQQNNVLINCTWPCFNPVHACVLTKVGAQCQVKHSNEWHIISPERTPVYTGAYSSIENHTCIPAPIPDLPLYHNSTVILKGQTVVQWPIVSTTKALDHYLGNCNHGMFCSSAGQDETNPICRREYTPGSACISSNQCRKSYCESSICHQSNITYDSTQSQDFPALQQSHQTKKTIVIVAAIISVLGVLGIIVLIFAITRFHRRRVMHWDSQDKFDKHSHDEPDPPLKNEIRRVSVASVRTEQDITPIMQQNLLQMELLKIHQKQYAKPPFYQI